jgi:hypothetical protein
MRAKRRFKKAGIGDVIGSSFAGYLEASWEDLVTEFGEPRWRNKEGPWRSSDQKVRCEWAFVIGSGKRRLVFTIYDYKEKRPIEEVSLWHIGAKGDTQRLDMLFAGRGGYSGSGML